MSDLPTPITREEQFLNGIATGDPSDLPTPVSREEQYLDFIAKNGGGGSGDGDMKKSVYDSDLSVSDAGGIGAFVSNAISGKVDKVEGKGLSTNDYDDTEKGKVADNTSAIGAIVNVTGAKNLLPDTYNTQTSQDVTFTKNADGSITISGTNSSGSLWANFFVINDLSLSLGIKVSDIFPRAGKYIITSEGNTQTSDIHNDLMIADVMNETIPSGTEIEITDAMMSKDIRMSFSVAPNAVISSPITIKPMIRDARITDPTYTPYAMTNRELTERVSDKYVSIVGDGVKTHQQLMNDLFALVDRSKISKKSKFSLYYNQTLEWICGLSFMSANKLQYDGITGGDATTLTAYHWELSSTLADCKRVDYTMTSSGLTVSDGSSTTPSASNEYRVYY